MTDKELAKAMARGDQAALLTFVRLYHLGVFQYMLSLVVRREDAEDLAVEAMLHSHQKIKSFRGDSSLKTWVHRVAYHQFTHWKRRQRDLRSLPDEVRCPSRPFDAVDEAEALREGLLHLPDTLRQPFVLFDINGLTLEEVASILDIPVGTVKSRLHFARTKLRELLTDKQEEPNVPVTLTVRRTH